MSYYRDSDVTASVVSLGAIVLMLVLAAVKCDGCEKHPMRAGFVVSRDYHPPYTTTVCHKVGRTTSCHPVHHPERFTITLADGHHDEKVIDMDREQWHQHPTGAWMCLHDGRCEHPHDDASAH